jgi:hypothetical protein
MSCQFVVSLYGLYGHCPYRWRRFDACIKGATNPVLEVSVPPQDFCMPRPQSRISIGEKEGPKQAI